jgi:hypothetical protein
MNNHLMSVIGLSNLFLFVAGITFGGTLVLSREMTGETVIGLFFALFLLVAGFVIQIRACFKDLNEKPVPTSRQSPKTDSHK